MSLEEYEIEVKNMINRIHNSYEMSFVKLKSRFEKLAEEIEFLGKKMVQLEAQCQSDAASYNFQTKDVSDLLNRLKEEKYELREMISDKAIDSNKLESIKKICEILRGYEDED